MKKGFLKHSLLLPIIVAGLVALAYSPVLAQDALKIEIKPCFQCPGGTTQGNGTFVCPDDDGDGSPDWLSCGVPAINLCSKGKTAVAILDFAEYGIDPSLATVVFEGATAIRCSRGDVDHDVVAGDKADDLICHFYTRELTGLQDQAARSRIQVKAKLTVTQGEETLEGEDAVVIFKRGNCKGL